jgi:hypothetical protein
MMMMMMMMMITTTKYLQTGDFSTADNLVDIPAPELTDGVNNLNADLKLNLLCGSGADVQEPG